GADQPVVDGDAAGAAIARAAAFLAAGEPERVAQDVEQRLRGITEELGRFPVDRGGDVHLGHGAQFPFARSMAIAVLRLSSTPAILVRYSMVPRLSLIGLQAARQAAAAFSSAASSSDEPVSALPASSTSSTVGATAPRPTRAAVHLPPDMLRLTPTPTTA